MQTPLAAYGAYQPWPHRLKARSHAGREAAWRLIIGGWRGVWRYQKFLKKCALIPAKT